MSDSKKPKQHKRVEEYSEVMRKEKPKDGFFQSFLAKPETITFEDKEENEQVVLVLRQHLVTQVKPTLFILFCAFFFPWLFSISGLLPSLPLRFQLGFEIFWFCLIISMFIHQFLIWFFNVYIITDERIIDVDFHSMISRDISSAKIENIEDVTSKAAGPLAAIFDYGTILIQTAGEQTEFEFEAVPQPAKVSKLLNELLLEEEREKIEGRVH